MSHTHSMLVHALTQWPAYLLTKSSRFGPRPLVAAWGTPCRTDGTPRPCLSPCSQAKCDLAWRSCGPFFPATAARHGASFRRRRHASCRRRRAKLCTAPLCLACAGAVDIIIMPSKAARGQCRARMAIATSPTQYRRRQSGGKQV